MATIKEKLGKVKNNASDLRGKLVDKGEWAVAKVKANVQAEKARIDQKVAQLK